MLKLSHANLTFISGSIWMAIGVFLLQLGVTLLLEPHTGPLPILHFFQSFFGGLEEAAIAVAVVALYIGFLKGKHVLSKSARKGVEHICSFPNPTQLSSIYSPKYYLLLALMMGLGMSIKYLGLPNDVRGAIDIIVGSALVNGAIAYFRMGLKLRSIG